MHSCVLTTSWFGKTTAYLRTRVCTREEFVGDKLKFLHIRKTFRYFSVIPPPPPQQKIRKTVEIVPEKMKKSSIEIFQILVLSKYN